MIKARILLSSLRDFALHRRARPSDESLGYCRESLERFQVAVAGLARVPPRSLATSATDNRYTADGTALAGRRPATALVHDVRKRQTWFVSTLLKRGQIDGVFGERTTQSFVHEARKALIQFRGFAAHALLQLGISIDGHSFGGAHGEIVWR